MSVTSPIPDENGFVFTAAGRNCFYCYAPLSDPAIFWMGATGDLYLHPRCVLDLFVRLARDVHESECPVYYGQIQAALRERAA